VCRLLLSLCYGVSFDACLDSLPPGGTDNSDEVKLHSGLYSNTIPDVTSGPGLHGSSDCVKIQVILILQMMHTGNTIDRSWRNPE